MLGVMVFGTIGLFYFLCWKLAGLLTRKKWKYYKTIRVFLFLIPGLLPVYAHLVEYVLLQEACEEAVAKFPERKIPAPTVLITNSSSFKNEGKIFGDQFDYIISPLYSNNRPIDLSKGIEQFDDYVVYPYKNDPVEGDVRKRVLANARYMFAYDIPVKEARNWYSFRIGMYIYDFNQKEKVASINEILSKTFKRDLYGYFHVRLSNCIVKGQPSEILTLVPNDLVEYTFKWKEK